ncbi:MAG: winged helix-turn-helix domain-containing protein [Phycisphaerae bacterium]
MSSGQPKRLSALNAAVKVLEERDPADGPLSCAQMIERMAAKGYWTPVRGGKTPANTLYAAILREINTKGEDSRFEKVERGRFTLGLKR